MIEFALGILVGVVAMYIVLKVLANILFKRLEKELAELDQELKMLDSVVTARVEEENGVFYIYSVNDNMFLAQGRTIDEIKQVVESRDATKKVMVTEGDPAVIDRLKATAQ
jgi:hypothetical protein